MQLTRAGKTSTIDAQFTHRAIHSSTLVTALTCVRIAFGRAHALDAETQLYTNIIFTIASFSLRKAFISGTGAPTFTNNTNFIVRAEIALIKLTVAVIIR